MAGQDGSGKGGNKDGTTVSSQSKKLAIKGKHIFEARAFPYKVPDGWKVTMGFTPYCESTATTKQLRSKHDYEKENKASTDFGGIDIGYASFSQSEEKTEFTKENTRLKKIMVSTMAECVDYVAELDYDKPPENHPSFQKIVEEAYTAADYYSLFDMYGLHFPTKIAFGARSGATRYSDESSYDKVLKVSETTTLEASVAYGYGINKGPIEIGVELSVTAASNLTDVRAKTSAMETLFSENVEFFIGARMPDFGQLGDWMEDVAEEPMPFRYELMSLCEHPAFVGDQKQDCVNAKESYCEYHLAARDGDIDCSPSPKPQCTFDLDCEERHYCNNGKCTQEPECWVHMYTHDHLNSDLSWWQSGDQKRTETVYRREATEGKVISLNSWWEDEVSSLTISGGCDAVTIIDEDNCMTEHEDNMMISLRESNENRNINSLPHDLDNDVCGFKLVAKMHYLPTNR